MPDLSGILVAWLVFSNCVAFLLFGWDKWRSVGSGWRVPEFQLALWGAVGGWLGGLLGMLVFRHKISKGSFQLKYAAALLAFVALAWVWWEVTGV